jgi:hypothetical protein
LFLIRTSELVEPVHHGKVFITVPKMIFSDLRRGITVRLKQFGDSGVLVLNVLLGGRHAGLQQSGAERCLSQDKGCTAGGARLLA